MDIFCVCDKITGSVWQYCSITLVWWYTQNLRKIKATYLLA